MHTPPQLIYNLYNLLSRELFDSNVLQKMLHMQRQFACNLPLSPFPSEVWSAIKINEQRNDLVMHSLDNLNRRGSIINEFSDLTVQCGAILKANILK